MTVSGLKSCNSARSGPVLSENRLLGVTPLPAQPVFLYSGGRNTIPFSVCRFFEAKEYVRFDGVRVMQVRRSILPFFRSFLFKANKILQLRLCPIFFK